MLCNQCNVYNALHFSFLLYKSILAVSLLTFVSNQI